MTCEMLLRFNDNAWDDGRGVLVVREVVEVAVAVGARRVVVGDGLGCCSAVNRSGKVRFCIHSADCDPHTEPPG